MRSYEKQSDNNLSITNNDFLKYEDGKYYSDISDSVVYANYTLTTVATQATAEDSRSTKRLLIREKFSTNYKRKNENDIWEILEHS